MGPFIGAIIAAVLYHLLKAMGYETANPGQDDDGLDTYRIVQAPVRPARPRRSQDDAFYNTYFQDLTSPPPASTTFRRKANF